MNRVARIDSKVTISLNLNNGELSAVALNAPRFENFLTSIVAYRLNGQQDRGRF
jgi:hypothetical protein